MLYFKGVKNKKVVAIGYDPKNVLPTCKILVYSKITKTEYNSLDKTIFNAPQQGPTTKHKKLAR